MNKKTNILAFKIEAYDYLSFEEQIKEKFPKSTIIKFNPHSNAKVVYDSNLIENGDSFNFTSFYIKNRNLYYLFYPVIFFVDFFKIFFLLKKIKFKKKYDYFFTDNTYACVAFKLLNIKTNINVVYASHDWLAGTKGNGIWSYIGKNFIFIVCDYISCKNSFKVLNHTQSVQKLRNNYWKNNNFNQILYYPKIFLKKIDVKKTKIKNKILFLGLVRNESGLSYILKNLKKNFDQKKNLSLKIVGILNEETTNLLNNKTYSNFINSFGFGERNNFSELFSDCFCGLCLVTSSNSYTSNTIPSKVIDYIQYVIPEIATKNLGYTSDIIEKNKLGLLVENDLSNLMDQIDQIYINQNIYKDHISKYLSEYKYTNISEIFI